LCLDVNQWHVLQWPNRYHSHHSAEFALHQTEKKVQKAYLGQLRVPQCSTQVLNEYYSVMLRKRFADNLIQDNVEVIIEVTDIRVVEIATIRRAHQVKLKYGFSYCRPQQFISKLTLFWTYSVTLVQRL